MMRAGTSARKMPAMRPSSCCGCFDTRAGPDVRRRDDQRICGVLCIRRRDAATRTGGRPHAVAWLPFSRYRQRMNADDILFERRGAAGLVTLNRPQALNAVTHGMVTALTARLAAWAADPAVTRVIIRAAGDRAFSAGGDIRALYELGRAGRQADMLPFWRDEYRLNHLIKHYPKPYVALIDGIVMGGGVGISVHGSHRVAGDKFAFAMPEVGIGFFPDVGATWFLPRLPGRLGIYCALTGERLDGADAVVAGIATHRVPSARFPNLIESLCDADPVEESLAACAQSPARGAAAARRNAITALFEA